MHYSNLLSPKPSEMLHLQEALEKLISQKSSEHLNLSLSYNEASLEEAIKLIKMKNKMSVYELKCLVSQLIDFIKAQNALVKKQLLNYEAQMIVHVQQLVSVFATINKRKQIPLRRDQLKTATNYMSQKALRQVDKQKSKVLMLQAECSAYKANEMKLSKQIKFLKEQVELKQSQIKILKQQNYKVYEENFSMQTKINDLQGSYQEQHTIYLKTIESLQMQKKQLIQSIQSLQLIIRSKENSLESLQNNLKNSNRKLQSREDFQAARFISHKNSSQQLQNTDPMQKGYYSNSTSRHNFKQNLDTKYKNISEVTIQKPRISVSREKNQVGSSPSKDLGIRSRARTINLNVGGRDRKSRSRDNNHFSKIQMQLDQLCNQIQTDLRISTQGCKLGR